MSKQLSLPFPPEEEWRDVPGWDELYRVSNMGHVYSLRRDKMLSLKPTKSGYVMVQLRSCYIRVHQLVMLAFVGNPPDGMEINHKNGVRHDNRLENLEYITHSQNIRHAVTNLGRKIGRYDRTGIDSVRGENHSQAKLTNEQVREIRRLYDAGGITTKQISEIYHVSTTSIRRVVNHKAWQHIE